MLTVLQRMFAEVKQVRSVCLRFLISSVRSRVGAVLLTQVHAFSSQECFISLVMPTVRLLQAWSQSFKRQGMHSSFAS